MTTYTKRTEVMNPPESAAQGSEARNLNMVQRHGTGAVPQGMEAQATQPSAAPMPRCICGRGAYYHPWRFCDEYRASNTSSEQHK
jgi:hypothetical protein